jgi:hypothetical protein
MKIIYVYNETPSTIGGLPPSVVDSDWFKNLLNFIREKVVYEVEPGVIARTTVTFDNDDELNNFLSTYTLTDPILIEDIRVWRQAYNIEAITTVTYEDGTPISITPIF